MSYEVIASIALYYWIGFRIFDPFKELFTVGEYGAAVTVWPLTVVFGLYKQRS